MKTSLLIDDMVFKEAKKEAEKSGKTISQVISQWALLGRGLWRELQKKKKPSHPFKAQNLGKPFIDITNRKEWMEELDNDRS